METAPEEESKKRGEFNPLAYSLRLLKSRIRSVHEVEAALAKHGTEPERIAAVIKQLVEARLLDDLEFARSWTRTRDRLTPRGEAVLRQELYQKGISKEISSQVLSERKDDPEEHSEDDLARELVRRKERTYANLTPEVRLRRQMAMLQRRGFSYDVIKRILAA